MDAESKRQAVDGSLSWRKEVEMERGRVALDVVVKQSSWDLAVETLVPVCLSFLLRRAADDQCARDGRLQLWRCAQMSKGGRRIVGGQTRGRWRKNER